MIPLVVAPYDPGQILVLHQETRPQHALPLSVPRDAHDTDQRGTPTFSGSVFFQTCAVACAAQMGYLVLRAGIPCDGNLASIFGRQVRRGLLNSAMQSRLHNTSLTKTHCLPASCLKEGRDCLLGQHLYSTSGQYIHFFCGVCAVTSTVWTDHPQGDTSLLQMMRAW